MALKKVPLKRSNKPLRRTVKDHPLPPSHFTREEVQEIVESVVKEKKGLKRTVKLSRKKKSKEQLEQDKQDRQKMKDFFLYCQEQLGSVSQISGRVVYNPGTINYHHCYEKAVHPELKYSLFNILVCSAEEHVNIHNDAQRYEAVQIKLSAIRNYWEECIQQSQSWSDKYDQKQALIWLTQQAQELELGY